jgi:chromosome segregation ATPase
VSDDTGVDSDKAALLRLARELAEQRHADHELARVELEQLKQALRERAEAVAARERELMDLQRRLDNGKTIKPARQGRRDVVAGDALVARERAALERAQALELRERQLQARQAELEADAARFAEREQELESALAGALAQRGQSESERELAAAERARLEEREQEARRIEKELAARRIELEAEQSALEARARALEAQAAALRATNPELELEPVSVAEAPAATVQREDELRLLEAKLGTRERELALMRQGLDAERNALLDRERSLRRREVADVRQTFDAPLAPPSFSEGLAAFARGRSRE